MAGPCPSWNSVQRRTARGVRSGPASCAPRSASPWRPELFNTVRIDSVCRYPKLCTEWYSSDGTPRVRPDWAVFGVVGPQYVGPVWPLLVRACSVPQGEEQACRIALVSVIIGQTVRIDVVKMAGGGTQRVQLKGG